MHSAFCHAYRNKIQSREFPHCKGSHHFITLYSCTLLKAYMGKRRFVHLIAPKDKKKYYKRHKKDNIGNEYVKFLSLFLALRISNCLIWKKEKILHKICDDQTLFFLFGKSKRHNFLTARGSFSQLWNGNVIFAWFLSASWNLFILCVFIIHVVHVLFCPLNFPRIPHG